MGAVRGHPEGGGNPRQAAACCPPGKAAMDHISELHRAESELRGEVLESRAGAGPFSDDLRAA